MIYIKSIKILIAVMLVCSSICVSVYGAANMNSTIEKGYAEDINYDKLNNDLAFLINSPRYGVPGLGVAVMKDGRLVYEKTMGSRYVDNRNRQNDLPFTSDTKIRIASLSKTFVAVAYMQLAEQGKIDLDEDISKYLGFTLRNPNFPDISITSKMLLSHTSSLRDGEIYSAPQQFSVKEFFDKDGAFYENGAHFAPKEEAPGEFFYYANLNYGLLATIIEKVTQTRFDVYIKSAILDPMEMEASFNLGDFDSEDLYNLGAVYKKINNGYWDSNGPWVAQVDDYKDLWFYRPSADYKIGVNATVFFPQGGLRISLKDLEKWMYMFINNGEYNGRRILSKKSIDEMFEPYWTLNSGKTNGDTYGGVMCCFGLGIQNMKNIYKDRFVADRDIEMSGHFGEAYGLLSGMFVDRKNKNGFIYIMNGMGSSENENTGTYSGMYRWEELICTAILNNAFAEL